MKILGLSILIVLAVPTAIDIVDSIIGADSFESGWTCFKSKYGRSK